jgi:hypothetical protein
MQCLSIFGYGEMYSYGQQSNARLIHDVHEAEEFGQMFWFAHRKPECDLVRAVQHSGIKVFLVLRDFRPAIVSLAKLLLGLGEYVEEYGLQGLSLTGVVDAFIFGKRNCFKYKDFICEMIGWACLDFAKCIWFEDFYSKPLAVCQEIQDFLGLRIPKEVVSSFEQNMKKHAGDSWKNVLTPEQDTYLQQLNTLVRGGKG